MEKLLAKAEALDFSTDSDDEAWFFIFSILLSLLLSLLLFQLFINILLTQSSSSSDRQLLFEGKSFICLLQLLIYKRVMFLRGLSTLGKPMKFFHKIPLKWSLYTRDNFSKKASKSKESTLLSKFEWDQLFPNIINKISLL
jgi:hypothetical protein